MCGRFTLFTSFGQLIERFEIASSFEEGEYVQSYNVAPSQSVVSVINDGRNNRLGYFRWGLVPSWAKDEKIGYKMINARAETITEKPSYRSAFQRRRCLILADSFYEWKRNGNEKTPMRIKMKSDEPFGMAGIWETWVSPSGNKVHSCAVITTQPNSLVQPIHDRMPVILRREDEERWLNPANRNVEELYTLLKPFDEQSMEAFEVSNDVNSPKNNSPQLIQSIC